MWNDSLSIQIFYVGVTIFIQIFFAFGRQMVFYEAIKNVNVTVDVAEIITLPDSRECIGRCLLAGTCKAIIMWPLNNTILCSLLNLDRSTVCVNITTSPDSLYLDTLGNKQITETYVGGDGFITNCDNGGTCVVSPDLKRYCKCGEFYSGHRCQQLQDLFSMMMTFCDKELQGSIPLFGPPHDNYVPSLSVFRWRCYLKETLSPDLNYYIDPSIAVHYTRPYLRDLVDNHPEVKGKYFVGNLGESCYDHCNTKGANVSCNLNIINSTYFFKLGGGVTCDIHMEIQDNWSDNLQPYLKGGKCHGFINVPSSYDCSHGKDPEARRLCKCTN